MGEAHQPDAFERGVMVDVGPGVGALVIYSRPELQGHEVEISPTGDDMNRTHTEFLRRTTAVGHLFAAVFSSLPEGDYRLWHETSTQQSEVRIVGGQVSEIDWR